MATKLHQLGKVDKVGDSYRKSVQIAGYLCAMKRVNQIVNPDREAYWRIKVKQPR